MEGGEEGEEPVCKEGREEGGGGEVRWALAVKSQRGRERALGVESGGREGRREGEREGGRESWRKLQYFMGARSCHASLPPSLPPSLLSFLPSHHLSLTFSPSQLQLISSNFSLRGFID